jgi:type IV secretory pathway VirB2 component (pilin)
MNADAVNEATNYFVGAFPTGNIAVDSAAWLIVLVIVGGAVYWVFRTSAAVERARTLLAGTLKGIRSVLAVPVLVLLSAISANAQSDPWSTAITKLAAAFSGPIVRGFAIVLVIVGGLELAVGEGHLKKTIAALVLGLGMALGAASFIAAFLS